MSTFDNNKMSRREFNQKVGQYLGASVAMSAAIPALFSCTRSEDQGTGTTTEEPSTSTQGQQPSTGDIKMVDVENPTAKALNYCEDAHEPQAHCPDRATAERDGQYCSNCMFFNMNTARTTDGSELTDVNAQQRVAVAECQLLPGIGFVAGQGWCRSWAARQG